MTYFQFNNYLYKTWNVNDGVSTPACSLRSLAHYVGLSLNFVYHVRREFTSSSSPSLKACKSCNLYCLNGVRLYNTFHTVGVRILNSKLVRLVGLRSWTMKGCLSHSFNSRFGNRNSSFIRRSVYYETGFNKNNCTSSAMFLNKKHMLKLINW